MAQTISKKLDLVEMQKLFDWNKTNYISVYKNKSKRNYYLKGSRVYLTKTDILSLISNNYIMKFIDKDSNDISDLQLKRLMTKQIGDSLETKILLSKLGA